MMVVQLDRVRQRTFSATTLNTICAGAGVAITDPSNIYIRVSDGMPEHANAMKETIRVWLSRHDININHLD